MRNIYWFTNLINDCALKNYYLFWFSGWWTRKSRKEKEGCSTRKTKTERRRNKKISWGRRGLFEFKKIEIVIVSYVLNQNIINTITVCKVLERQSFQPMGFDMDLNYELLPNNMQIFINY